MYEGDVMARPWLPNMVAGWDELAQIGSWSWWSRR